jgi:hypothetical protein
MSATPVETAIQNTSERVGGDASDNTSANRNDDMANSSNMTKLSALNRILRRTVVTLVVVWVTCPAFGCALDLNQGRADDQDAPHAVAENQLWATSPVSLVFQAHVVRHEQVDPRHP